MRDKADAIRDVTNSPRPLPYSLTFLPYSPINAFRLQTYRLEPLSDAPANAMAADVRRSTSVSALRPRRRNCFGHSDLAGEWLYKGFDTTRCYLARMIYRDRFFAENVNPSPQLERTDYVRLALRSPVRHI
jgi:hypothetical protein